MKLTDFILEGPDAPLYRAMQLEFALDSLNANKIAGTTKHRFWKHGKRYNDAHPEWDDAFWMKGVSLTRDIKFAQSWATVVFQLDQRRLQQTYKIIPFNWGFGIAGGYNHHKMEREEFVVLKKTFDRYWNETHDSKDHERWKMPEGAIEPLDRYLVHIYADEILQNPRWESEIEDVKVLTSHPKFRGWFKNPKRS